MIRIIPRMDVKGPHVVKGVFTEGLKIVGDPKKMAVKYYEAGADELIYMDIVASLYQRNLDFDLLKSVAEDIFIPLTAGGGIRSVHDIANALRSGADKVAINTSAIGNPKFLSEAAHTFGSQCIVLSVEAKRNGPASWEAYTDGGRERSGRGAIDWIRQALDLGIGEVLITSIDRDGTLKGFDTELVTAVASISPVPVIAHGGAGSMQSMIDCVQHCTPDALALASVLHFDRMEIRDIKTAFKKEGIAVRVT